MSLTPTAASSVRPPEANAPDMVRRFARDVLDQMPLPDDLTYFDLKYTEQLVVETLWRVRRYALPGGRVLLIGGNSYLTAAVRASGLRVDVWRVGDAPTCNEDSRGRVLDVSEEQLECGPLPAGEAYDVVVLPFVLEHLRTNPEGLLRALSQVIATSGRIIAVTSNATRLGSRFRALLGKGSSRGWTTGPSQPPGGWPSLKEYHSFSADELAYWCHGAGYGVEECVHLVGQQAIFRSAPPAISRYLLVKSKHALQLAVPELRDYILVTLQPGKGPLPLPALTGNRREHETPSEDALLPYVSVVLPSRNRAALLRPAIEALFAQTYPADRYEIVVVDDGSEDETPRILEEMALRSPCRFRSVRTEGIGAAAARNLGMRLAEGEIAAHIDDDAFAVPTWLEQGVRGFERNVAVVSGAIKLREDEAVPFFSATMQYPSDEELYPTANVFYRRELALAEGGFDESFGQNLLGRPVWGWDSDLGWRLRRKGYEARFRPGALAHAQVFPLSPRRWLLEGWRAAMLAGVVRAIPELRSRMLVLGLFSPYAVNFKIGLVGTALALLRRERLWLLAWVPWVHAALRLMQGDWWPPLRWPRLGVKLGFMFAQQVIMNVALVRGSIRARRAAL